MEKVYQILKTQIENWLGSAYQALPHLTVALIVLGSFYVLAKIAEKNAERLLRRMAKNPTLINLMSGTTRLAVLFLGIFIALHILELDKTVTSLLAGAGILGLALGFAFKDILSNYIAGVILAFHQPFQLQDIIETHGYFGTVEVIDLRSTTIRTFSGQLAIIPNSMVFSEPIINYSKTGVRRMDLLIGISYGEDLRNVQKITLDAVSDLPHSLPYLPPEFFFEGYGDSSINFQLRIWVKYPGYNNFFETKNEAIIRIKEAYNQNGITIPFPIRTLDFGIKGGVPLSDILPK